MLAQIADLTSIRDVELLEMSMLDTVAEFLLPTQLRLYRLDGDNQILSAIDHDGETAQVKIANVEPSYACCCAFAQLDVQTESHFYKGVDEGLTLTVYRLYESRYSKIYLTIYTPLDVSSANMHLMNGMLKIFRNFCVLLDDAQRDPLTGLANRMTFDDQLNQLAALVTAKNYGNENVAGHSGFWLAMLDVDYFKAVNDKFGHLYGDEVLVLLARLMEEQLRSTDRLFRYGGEEFVTIVGAKQEQDAREIFERLRAIIEVTAFPQVGHITMSMGVTAVVSGALPSSLLDHADQALYQSKANGRNQVTFFEDMVKEGSAELQCEEGGEVDLF